MLFRETVIAFVMKFLTPASGGIAMLTVEESFKASAANDACKVCHRFILVTNINLFRVSLLEKSDDRVRTKLAPTKLPLIQSKAVVIFFHPKNVALLMKTRHFSCPRDLCDV